MLKRETVSASLRLPATYGLGNKTIDRHGVRKKD
jgi:hypothetical protein